MLVFKADLVTSGRLRTRTGPGLLLQLEGVAGILYQQGSGIVAVPVQASSVVPELTK